MNLGYLTACTAQECELAARLGFDCIEAVAAWEIGELQDDAFLKGESGRIKDMLSEAGISISALALFKAGRFDVRERAEHYRGLIRMCEALGVEVLTTLTGGDPAKGLEENLADFAAVFREVAPAAEGAGVRIAFENWPGLPAVPPMGTKNFGFTPQAWEMMFNEVQSEALGLEFDPSHLVWQQADWAAALRRFAHKVYHVHAKDTEIFPERLAANGFFSAGWWRYRLPGYGVVDWHNLTSILKEIGYDGAVCIEHEDPVFSGERRAEGLQKGHDYLRPLM